MLEKYAQAILFALRVRQKCACDVRLYLSSTVGLDQACQNHVQTSGSFGLCTDLLSFIYVHVTNLWYEHPACMNQK